uniref:DUF4351 domain-containing protein n=1 Tax=Candidatus Kentrum sp. FW TaxID=2126338 RepID=A0A450SRH2_9GAMM|nr:MAG: hypothetical protein BECKFW1821A_GA0114235_106213 [Candidatus Kentron sp. FW]
MEYRESIRREAAAGLLLGKLSHRFGETLSDSRRCQVYEADPGTIRVWAKRILDAESLNDVFQE